VPNGVGMQLCSCIEIVLIHISKRKLRLQIAEEFSTVREDT
jgi:hypothetical protein